MGIAGQCGTWKITNGALNFVLQTLQFQKLALIREFPYRAEMGHYGPNQCLSGV
jgi:hypothetical protein